MAKEHLEFNNAENRDDLIAELADLNERIEAAREELFSATDEDTKGLYRRQVTRLNSKKDQLLVALKQSLEGMAS